MNIRSQSLILVSLLAAGGCSTVAPTTPLNDTGSTVLAAAAKTVSTKKATFDAWDTDHDSRLSLAEYEAGFLSIIQPAPTPDTIGQLKSLIDAEFQRLDKNQDGYLSYAEFRTPNVNQLGTLAPSDLLDGNAFLDVPDPTSPGGASAAAA
ncbi:MAG: EF-hand domain-containing protein [Cyanobacteria bacterium REEB65]|nr:EF-hand domain-containing protein [Cyanobacteria bacterium REEB65]